MESPLHRRSTDFLYLMRSPKRFNMKATIELGKVAVDPDTSRSIRNLGLQFDAELKWGSHLATVKTKRDSQGRELTVVAGTTPFFRT